MCTQLGNMCRVCVQMHLVNTHLCIGSLMSTTIRQALAYISNNLFRRQLKRNIVKRYQRIHGDTEGAQHHEYPIVS